MTTWTARAMAAALLLACMPLVGAMQPDAVPPLPAPMRPLQWGEINFLHTTDTHGWHAGHLQESQYSADWGDYVSFADHMRRRADEDGIDLLLVDTGDRVEGNGLYDASTPKGQYTYDIFRQQKMDVICSGNHELYQADTADREHWLTVPNFAGTYLASNLDYVADPATGTPPVPMAPQRYRAFQTKHGKINVVAFGFLFNFTGNAANSVVQPVQQTVREPWFQHAIRDEPADLFVVIGHVGARMPELRAIYEAIRAAKPHTPIAIFAGHAHVRDTVRFDDKALALASGRYFETIGWMSISGITGDKVSSVSFHRRYIDNNLLGLYYHSGVNATTFPTDHGRNVTAAITAARADLGLETRYGCAPQNYWLLRRPHRSPDSVFSLLRRHVLPDAIVRADRATVPRIVLINTGAIRFDIFRGAFTRDTTFIVSPFVSRVHYIPDVPYALARQVLPLMNNHGPILSAMAVETDVAADAAAAVAGQTRRPSSGVTDWRALSVPEQYAYGERLRAAHTTHTKVDVRHRAAREDEAVQVPLFGSEVATETDNGGDGGDDDTTTRPPLVAGYTTWDDVGFDGDDAIHEPLPFFPLPNCIQAEVAFPTADRAASDSAAAVTEETIADEPATVDLIFFDFIEKFVLQALTYAARRLEEQGGQPHKRYTEVDIETYLEGKFTDHFVDWVKTHWKDECTR